MASTNSNQKRKSELCESALEQVKAGKRAKDAAKAQDARSAAVRAEGNQLYIRLEDGLAPAIFKSRVEQCLERYQTALALAHSPKEKAAAHKNIGKVNFLYARKLEDRKRMSLLAETLRHTSAAIEFGLSAGNSQTWLDTVYEDYQECREQASELVQDPGMGLDEMLGWRCKLAACIHPSQHAELAEAYLQTADTLHKEGLKSTAGKQEVGMPQVVRALKCFKEAYQPLTQLQQVLPKLRASRDPEVAQYCQFYQTELDVVMDAVDIGICTCEAQQEKFQGEAHLSTALNSSEEINMTAVYLAMDSFKRAVLLTRERDIELEAISEARLAYIYHKVLKKDFKAKENYKRSLDLAHSMHPIPMDKAWYKEMKAAMMVFQKQKEAQEAEAEAKNRQPHMDALKKEVAALDEAVGKGTIAFLDHIYATHPPKNSNHKRPDTGPESDMQSALRRSITHYHPDKQNKHGMRWKVLAEEICKRITAKYNLHNPCAVFDD